MVLGEPGIKGEPGVGLRGVKGEPGINGTSITGPKGEMGEPGAAGIPGVSVKVCKDKEIFLNLNYCYIIIKLKTNSNRQNVYTHCQHVT